MTIDFRSASVDTPEWWLVRLIARLYDRLPALARFDEYYRGEQPLAFAGDRWRTAFGERFGRAFSSNFMALVVDGTRERLEVQGFRFKDKEGDSDLWDLWQENDMDAASQIAHTQALVKGIAYTLVQPGRPGEKPRITVEDPCDTIVETDPLDRRRRLAALKRWIDQDGRLVVFVYLPDSIYKYRTDRPWEDRNYGVGGGDQLAYVASWASAMTNAGFDRYRPEDEDWPLANLLGIVPVVPLLNRPNLRGEGQSEIAPVMSNQDVINKLRADAIVAAEYVAFPQRWIIGLEEVIDPETKKKISPFKAGVDQLWQIGPPDSDAYPDATKAPPVSLGQFPAADLSPYQGFIKSEIGAIASISRMPYHYLLGESQSIPPSGESIKSSEAGLVSKVRTSRIFLGDGWEETMRVALQAMGDDRSDLRTAETIWRDPETRNEGAITDALVKLWTAKILDDQDEALTIAGFSPEQIKRLRESREARAREAAAVPPPPEPVVASDASGTLRVIRGGVAGA